MLSLWTFTFWLLLFGIPAVVSVVLAIVSFISERRRGRIGFDALASIYTPILLVWAGILVVLATVSGDAFRLFVN